VRWADVWRSRLARHWLIDPAGAGDLPQVAGGVCGIHAQITASAELSLGLRVRGITRQHVRDALWKDRSLVKTYGLRGTLHLFPSAELPIWLAALRARTPPRPDARVLGESERARLVQAIGEVLTGRMLTREQLGAELEARYGARVSESLFPAFGGQFPRWQLALHQAALDGLIVFGPNDGVRVRYVRRDEWLGQAANEAVDGQAALREVARRYFCAYGPATSDEFARWFYLQPRAARLLAHDLAAAGVLVRVDVEGHHAWRTSGSDGTATPGGEPRVRLLPQFDCYVVGCHPRRQLIPEVAPAPLQKGTAAPFSVVLVDGVVGGLWERRKQGKALAIRVDTFAALTQRQKDEVEEDATRIGEILETRMTVSFGAVEPRAHL
jgi:hypothetical protein